MLKIAYLSRTGCEHVEALADVVTVIHKECFSGPENRTYFKTSLSTYKDLRNSYISSI